MPIEGTETLRNNENTQKPHEREKTVKSADTSKIVADTNEGVSKVLDVTKDKNDPKKDENKDGESKETHTSEKETDPSKTPSKVQETDSSKSPSKVQETDPSKSPSSNKTPPPSSDSLRDFLKSRRQTQMPPNNQTTFTPEANPTQNSVEINEPISPTDDKHFLKTTYPNGPEITEFGKAIGFGIKETANTVSRTVKGTILPVGGLIKSTVKLFSDLRHPVKLLKKGKKAYASNFGRILLAPAKAGLTLFSAPFSLAGSIYRGLHKTLEVIDKKILQNTPFICYASQYGLMPISGAINNTLSAVDKSLVDGQIGLYKWDNKLIQNQNNYLKQL